MPLRVILNDSFQSSRSDILLSMNGATEGQTFWHPKVIALACFSL